MISQTNAIILLFLCFQTVATASLSNCEDGSFSVTTLNVTTVQISSNEVKNISYTVTSNSSISDQYILEPNSTIVITGLCPGVYYSIDISNMSDSCIYIHRIEAISSLSVDVINATAANVTWQSVQGGMYTVYYDNSTLQLSGEINVQDSQVSSQDYASATATPLCPQVVYEFNVSFTIPNDQCFNISTQTSFINNNEELTGMISQFSYSDNVNESAPVGSSNRINASISWDAPDIINCPILEYKVTLDEFHFIHSSNSTHVLMVSDLLPNTQYTVMIVPTTIAGSGMNILETFTTTTDIPWDSPNDFQVQPNGENAVRFTWNAPTIPAVPIADISYTITVMREDGTITLLKYENIFLGNFGGLNRYERICGSIAAVSVHGMGPSSSTVCGHTSESRSDPVANLTYSVLKAGDVALSWDEPMRPYGIISQYKVKVYHSDGSFLQQSTSTERILLIENLDFDLTYMFEVVAVNEAGDGVKNFIYTYGSEETVTLFSDLTATITSHTSFEIAWTKADELNSYIFEYELEYYPREITTSYGTTSRVHIQSIYNKHVITGINVMVSYIVTLRAVSNHGVQSSQILVNTVTEQPSTPTDSDILQVRVYGYMYDCEQEDDSMVIGLLLEEISGQVTKHCNCNINIVPSMISSILCYANDSINVVRSLIPQSAIGYVLAWLKSPNPFLLINGNIILVDNSETCPYFVSNINAVECITTNSASKENSCDSAITGTFFGTLISSILIVSIVWLIVILLCTSYSRRNKNNEVKPKKWIPSLQRHRAKSHSYENVTKFKGADKLKLNTQPTGEVPVIDDENNDDIYTNEPDIKEMKKTVKQDSSKTSLKNPSAGEYMNIRTKRTPNNSRIENKATANVKKVPPTTKPKPKGSKTGDINLQSNEAYKASTRDECNTIILALQQKS